MFDRSRNHVHLTGAGQVFLAGARETLEAAAQAIASARKATRSAVPVPFRIGKFGFFTASFLSQALSLYKDTHPNVSISLFGMDPQSQLDGLLADQLTWPSCRRLTCSCVDGWPNRLRPNRCSARP